MKFNIRVYFSGLYGYQTTERAVCEEDFDTNIAILNRMLESGEIKSYHVFLKTDITADDTLNELMDKHSKEMEIRIDPCIN